MPNYYYDGTDPVNPLKVNPYKEEFYSKMARQYQPTAQTQINVPVNKKASVVNPQAKITVTEDYPYLPSDEFLPQRTNPNYGWEYDVPVLREDIVLPVKEKSTKKLGGKVYKK
jgi:hypothetical protein